MPPTSPRRSARRIAAVLGLLALLVFISIRQTAHPLEGTDFQARWLAGHWFAGGEPLYQVQANVREPSYPPFAAMVFQLFAWFPLRVAAAGFYFINLLLIPTAILLTRRIFRRLWPERSESWWPLAWATVFSIQFFLNNLNLVQVNAALFVLCLWGIDQYGEQHDFRTAAAFVVAAFVKIVPVFFVLWLFIRGRLRAAVAALGVSAVCLALPLVQRGVSTGVQDLLDYNRTFLQPFRESGVPAQYDRYTNQSLGAAVFRLMRPPAIPEEADYRLVQASPAATLLAYRIAAAAIGLAFVLQLVVLRWRGAPVTVFDWSNAFLVGALLSGITWKAHLVILLFVYCAFLSIPLKDLAAGLRGFVYACIVLMAGTGLAGRDIVGNAMHHWIGGYSLLTWTMVLLFAVSIALSWRPGSAVQSSAHSSVS